MQLTVEAITHKPDASTIGNLGWKTCRQFHFCWWWIGLLFLGILLHHKDSLLPLNPFKVELPPDQPEGWNRPLPQPPFDGPLLHTKEFTFGGANGTCLSIKERRRYPWQSQLPPSPALVHALRDYEAMHRRCVMGVTDWKAHFSQLQPGLEDCKYVVWKHVMVGVGNRFVSIMSAFEYALVTHRALLIDADMGDMKNLVCNPFEGSEVWKPKDLPPPYGLRALRLEELLARNRTHCQVPLRGAAVKVVLNRMKVDRERFFCEQVQQTLQSVPWLVWESNQYSGPALFLVPSFALRLLELFPDRAVTARVARYLLLPVDEVWRRVTGLYDAHMRNRTARLGLQVRTVVGYNRTHSQRVIECLRANHLLPAVEATGAAGGSWEGEAGGRAELAGPSSTSVLLLVVSLDGGFHRDLEEMYRHHSTVDVYTPSSKSNETHDVEANQQVVSEIWLLSLTDTLLISFRSTLGHVANALQGELPVYRMNIRGSHWKDDNLGVCVRGRSSNICYQRWPPALECPGESPKKLSAKTVPPYMALCQEMSAGRELVRADNVSSRPP